MTTLKKAALRRVGFCILVTLRRVVYHTNQILGALGRALRRRAVVLRWRSMRAPRRSPLRLRLRHTSENWRRIAADVIDAHNALVQIQRDLTAEIKKLNL